MATPPEQKAALEVAKLQRANLNFQLFAEPLSPDQPDFLEKLYRAIVEQATRAINWYVKNAATPRIRAIRLRLFGIIFVAIAGILPISDKIFTHLVPKDFRPDAAWATILIALAGLFFFLDRFLGYSSRWIRYTLTWIELQKALHTFEMDWQIARSAPKEDIDALLKRAKTFVEAINTILQNETNEWAAEFRDTLRQVDSMAQSQTRLNVQNAQTATSNTTEITSSQETLPALQSPPSSEEDKDAEGETIPDTGGSEPRDSSDSEPSTEGTDTGINMEATEAEETGNDEVPDTAGSETSDFFNAAHSEAESEPTDRGLEQAAGNLTLNVPNGERFDAWGVWLNGEVQTQRGQGTETTFSNLPSGTYKVEIRTQSATAVYRAETSVEVLPNETTTAKLRLFPQ